MKAWIVRGLLLVTAATLVPACGGSGFSGGTAGAIATAIGLFVSGLTASMQGGTGTVNNGGDGNSLDLFASTGSDIRLLKSGTVNSQVTIPVIKPDLGTNPRVVSANEEWTVDTGSGGVLGFNSNSIQGGTPGTATGLWVQQGVTLKIHPNFNGGGSASAHTFLQLFFSSSVYIQGTVVIQFQDTTASADALSDDCTSFNLGFDESLVISSTGSIILSGRADGPDVDTNGGNGGSLTLFGSRRTIVNAGIIDARGGAGEQGGGGGQVDLISFIYGVYNSGSVITSGGAGSIPSWAGPVSVLSNTVAAAGNTDYTLTAAAPAWVSVGNSVLVSGAANGNNNGTFTVVAVVGAVVTLNNGSGVADGASTAVFSLAGSNGSGGSAGSISLISTSGPGAGGVFNTGSLLAQGANGTSFGGSGGTINMQIFSGLGAVASSGVLNSSGGSALVASANGNGGDGSTINILSLSGTIRLTGSLITAGGNGAGTGNGGDGNTITINMQSSSAVSSESMTGGMAVGATIRTDGGNGASGGDAGWLNINADGGNLITPGQDIVYLVGYNSINSSGGAGQLDGGDGSDINITNDSINTNNTNWQGGILNDVSLVTRGGAGTTGNGGWGGNIDIFNTDNNIQFMGQKVVNTATLDTTGGAAALTGGQGGVVSLYDPYRIENSGSIVMIGGANTGTGIGGDGGGALIISDNVVVNSASINADGGASANGNGGWGGANQLMSRTTTSTGTISARGANGGINTGNVGGSGGDIEVFSTETTSALSGTFTVSAGTGEPIVGAGTHGQVRIDGNIVELTLGAIVFP